MDHEASRIENLTERLGASRRVVRPQMFALLIRYKKGNFSSAARATKPVEACYQEWTWPDEPPTAQFSRLLAIRG